MGLPEIFISFETAALTAISRSARGVLAVVLEDDSIAVRPMMWLSLTYDHRIVDGAPAAQFLKRVKALLENPSVCAFCYTQLTDVEQEQNGLYTYDRQAKFDPAAIRACTAKPAAIEREKN